MLQVEDEGKRRTLRLEEVRRFIGLFGLTSVLIAESSSHGTVQNIAAISSLMSLTIAALIMINKNRFKLSGKYLGENCIREHKTWNVALPFLGIFGALIIQPWFEPGKAIAGGDISPPFGTAWIGKLFSIYDWSGSNLGGVNSQQVQLPWASVSWFVHVLGGSGALAQRIWLSVLVAAIWVGMGSLAKSLGMSPLAGIIAAVVYFLNPFTTSNVGSNAVFLVAMALISILPAIIISYGRHNFKKWKLIFIFAFSAPFFGFACENPPLVGMIGVILIITPFIAGIRFGKEVRNKSLWGLLLGGIILIFFSSYWIVPFFIAIHGAATKTLTSIGGWKWTEGRSTLANAFWINTTWGWIFPAYYPYASDFIRFPLNLVRSAIPVFAFAGLAIRYKRDGAENFGLKRLYGILALLSLTLIFISTGTRSPGNILFNFLYGLPYGWLLKEPGRFLMLVALGYALLVGILIDSIGFESKKTIKNSTKNEYLLKLVKFTSSSRIIVSFLAICLALSAGFPIWMGSTVPSARPGFPSDHVKEPSYWKTFAKYLNNPTSPKGSLLVLPPDTFYQMPYNWYYGNDAFIVNMLKRNVLVPSSQGYSNVSSNLLKDVKLEALSLKYHRWKEASNLMTAMGTPLVLVRGDIKTQGDIISPAVLSASLKLDPLMQLVRRMGPLSVYKQRPIYKQNKFATINVDTPRLNLLSLLPGSTPLLRSNPIPGHTSVFQLPGLDRWAIKGNHLSYGIDFPQNWIYHPVIFGSSGASSFEAINPIQTKKLQSQIRTGRSLFSIKLGRSLIPGASFTSGPYPAGNCNDYKNTTSPSIVKAVPSSSGGPFGNALVTLQASSRAIACQATPLSWHGGPFLLDFWSRSLSRGSAPSVCILEEPIDKCAAIKSTFSPSSKWHQHKIILNPPPQAKSLFLFIYADSPSSGKTVKQQYSTISVRKLPFDGNVFFLGKTTSKNIVPINLLSTDKGFSNRWIEPKGFVHLAIDGLRNGWISKNAIFPQPKYIPAKQEIRLESLLSGFAFVGFFVAWGLEKKHSNTRK